MNTPLVSICCITYNHAQFIRKCLDGFLMQQTDFPIEILIHDDCSTDGTTEIIREYEAKYPELIFPLYEEENQYQHGKAAEIDFYNYRRARGKYIAYCEGDDYWTDPLKLQKQVDFMETNPEYSVCFHDCQKYDVRTGAFSETKFFISNSTKDAGIDVTNYMFLHKSDKFVPLTMLFRLSMFDYSWCALYPDYKDTYEIYHLLRVGKGRYLNFVGGVYNRHEGGVATSSTLDNTCKSVLKCALYLYRNNKCDSIVQNYLRETLLWSSYILSKKAYLRWLIVAGRVTIRIPLEVLVILLKRQIKSIVKK